MINFHPDEAMLAAYAADDLPVGMAIAVAIHVEYCPNCARKVKAIEERLAVNAFADFDRMQDVTSDYDDMLSFILSQPEETPVLKAQSEFSDILRVKDQSFQLPRALRHVARQNWRHLGNVGQTRLQLPDELAGRASLFLLSPGASVPKHTHDGMELMLPLSGTFKDELGLYHPGDFIVHDNQVNHQPITDEGCLCFALLDAPVRFTQGLPKLLNSFGDLLY